MKLTLLICLICLTSCSLDKGGLESLNNDEINQILSHLDESDILFTSKDVTFDSIATYAGTRELDGSVEKIKVKLFFYDGLSRGYFNLPAKDIKNLQVFGKLVEDKWIFKCVTKLNMEEVGGYIIVDGKANGQWTGIWSNGHVNFKKGKVSLIKQERDYNILTDW